MDWRWFEYSYITRVDVERILRPMQLSAVHLSNYDNQHHLAIAHVAWQCKINL